MVSIKRVYDKEEPSDGYRVLVDRLWPRGVRKADLSFDLWAKELAPSTEARKEFNHDPAKFEAFKGRYLQELDQSAEAAKTATELLSHDRVTLLYAAKDPQVNHAVVLRDWLERQSEAGSD